MRKIRNATHEDREYENNIEIRRAIIKIEIPSDNGLIMKNRLIAIDEIIMVNMDINMSNL
jgi:hypothetical protein